ncbi:hypothetical protein CC86DRAFT_367560 [Ophiobolus disseminans]|uniref:Large ribosomal subunit protein bL28m n=1 Tax=Ophiobolus disseminans TaxID=1469910 RepID=A0A6A7A8I2_9PLEO|nr:hypothetical protein CC86DRAFT_367560 [Ophiobolus disseminans]
MQPRCQLLSACLSSPRTIFAAPPTQRTYVTAVPTPAVKNPLQRRKGGDLGSHLPKHVIPKDAYIPAYPYGHHVLYKQANRGLYGGQMIQFGNNVSRKTETKTRRDWKPNVLRKSLYSVALKKKIKLRITSRVLKTMDREGGLDEYLLKDNEHRLKELGPLGWALRWALLQKPDVIYRMRTEAAALGLDQATIDAQWPTRHMLDRQKAPQSGLVKAADLIPEEYEENAEDLVEGVDEVEGEEREPLAPGTYTPQEERIMHEAKVEYTKAMKASQRYLSRGHVDSEEEGLKLAFIRAKEREDAASRLKQSFAKKLDEQFSSEDLDAVRTQFSLPATVSQDALKKIAYNQWRRQQIELAGSYDAWRTNVDAAKALEREASIDAAGGREAWEAGRKVMYSNMIDEAETASTNTALDAARRKYLETALNKADRAIKAKPAGGEDAYVDATIDELRETAELRRLEQSSKIQKEAGGDAWAELVDASDRPADSRPNA